MTESEKEKKKLEDVKTELDKSKEYYLKKLEDLDNNKGIDPDLAQALAVSYLRNIQNIERHSASPYFAKLIYKDEEEQSDEELYIGKVGFADRNNSRIVIDWRAPISSLYYDSEVGKVSYVAPGDLPQIINFEKEDESLLEYFKNDSCLNEQKARQTLQLSSFCKQKS